MTPCDKTYLSRCKECNGDGDLYHPGIADPIRHCSSCEGSGVAPGLLAWVSHPPVRDMLIVVLRSKTPDYLFIPGHEPDYTDPTAVKILLDSLEEAGCDKEVILAHLRGQLLHDRHCWALQSLALLYGLTPDGDEGEKG